MNTMASWDEDLFFNKYWCKQPCVIKQITNQDCYKKLDPNEISTLAMENDIVSRLVYYNSNIKNKIKLEFGPFDEKKLTRLPSETPWSLLIQDVDKKAEILSDLLIKFSKIPAEFFDDVMASIGNNGSGTGPHLDWYNVFIFQTHGKKNWRVEKAKRTFKEHDEDIIEGIELKILKTFNEYYEYNLSPGELLYIPPGHGHHGISTENISMSFSIGYQGPRLTTLIETYLSSVLKNIHEDERINYHPTNLYGLDLANWPKEIAISENEDFLKLLKIAKEQDY